MTIMYVLDTELQKFIYKKFFNISAGRPVALTRMQIVEGEESPDNTEHRTT